MIDVFSDIMQFRGSHYDLGKMQGEILKNSPILANRQKLIGHLKKYKYIVDVNEIKEVFQNFSPKIWEEIEGIREALQMGIEEALQEFGGYYLEYGRSGCSILTGTDYFVRNYDNAPETYEGRFFLYQPTDGGLATIGPTMQITGRTDGMNEAGLVMGYNFVNRKNAGSGFVCNMIGRIILETCRNVEEAIDLLKEIPHRHSFNYVLLDNSGETFVVEASPKRVDVRKGNYCTNHFHLLNEENRYQMTESEAREAAIARQMATADEAYEAFRILNDSSKGVFSKKYGAYSGTLHTACYLPNELQVWFSLGENLRPVIFDFQKWLNGQKLYVKKVKGKLDAKSGFINRVEE